jgi:hypothetical protein
MKQNRINALIYPQINKFDPSFLTRLYKIISYTVILENFNNMAPSKRSREKSCLKNYSFSRFSPLACEQTYLSPDSYPKFV